MKTVSTYQSSQSRAQCRADDTCGAGFVSGQGEASATGKAIASRHKRGNIFRRAIATLFHEAREVELRALRKRVKAQRRELQVMQGNYDSLWRSFCNVMDEYETLRKPAVVRPYEDIQ